MSIHVDLLIPSFSTPFAGGLEEPFKESELQNLQDQCASAFGVDERSIQIFKMVNNKMDVRVGCYINSTDLNMDVISHTMKQNKVLQDLLAKSTEAVLQFQQQRDNDLRQLLATTHELTELKLAHQELKSKIKLLKMKKQLAENDHQQQQQLFKPDLSRSQNPDTTRSRFMDRLANTPLQSSPPHSLAASAPSIPPPTVSSLLSSPSSPSLSLSDESIPPGPSGMVPLDISDSPPSPINSDMVSEHLRKKLIALAKDGPYYSYSGGVSSSPPSRPLTASKPSPPAGPRPGSHASPRLGSRVLSRATLQWDLAEAANGKDDRTSPPISSTPPSITSTLSILPRASTPKNIRVTTPRSHQSPRRTFIDPFHLSTPAGVVQLPASSSSSPHDTLVVRGKNV